MVEDGVGAAVGGDVTFESKIDGGADAIRGIEDRFEEDDDDDRSRDIVVDVGFQ